MKTKKPKFLRQEWFRLVSLGKKWRRPRGKQSKLRKHIKGKGFIPNVGYGTPKAVRGLHPSGLKEILVSNLNQINDIDPKKQCIRMARTVGIKKRIEIMNIAKEKEIRVLNPQRTVKPEKKKVELKKEDKKTEEKPVEKKQKTKKEESKKGEK